MLRYVTNPPVRLPACFADLNTLMSFPVHIHTTILKYFVYLHIIVNKKSYFCSYVLTQVRIHKEAFTAKRAVEAFPFIYYPVFAYPKFCNLLNQKMPWHYRGTPAGCASILLLTVLLQCYCLLGISTAVKNNPTFSCLFENFVYLSYLNQLIQCLSDKNSQNKFQAAMD